MREKEMVLGEEEGKTKLRGRGSIETYRQYENWPNMLGYFQPIIYSIFLIFIILYTRTLFYFLSNESIKYPFIFFQTIILTKLFLLIYLIIKT